MAFLLEALSSVKFLEGAGDATVRRFMGLGTSVDWSKGHQLWRAGAAPQALVVAVTGEARTSTYSPAGREFIDRFLGCGDCMGLAGALDGLPYPTDGYVTRAGEFFLVARAALLRFLEERPAVRVKATEMLGALYRRAMKERQDVALRPVPRRLAEFLLRHACVRGTDGARVLVGATQADVAARLGTVREVVSRILGDFERRGIVERDGQGLLVSDWEGLEAEADAGGDDAAVGSAEESREERTRRHFLPMTERRRRGELAEDSAPCRERLGDLAVCRARGCPAALEERLGRTAAAAWRPSLVGGRSGAPAGLRPRLVGAAGLRGPAPADGHRGA